MSAGRGQVPGAALPHDGLLHAPLRHEPALQLPRGLHQRPRQQSDIGNKTLLLHLIWTVTSPNFVSRVEVRAGKVDPEHAEDKRGAVPAEPVHHVACAAQEEVPGEEAQEDARPAQVLPHNAERHHAEGARHEVCVHLFNIMIKDRC